MQATGGISGAQLTPSDVMNLSYLATAGLVVMWAVFWFAIIRSRESVNSTLQSPAFFRTVAVMGVIAGTLVLSLAGRLEGHIAASIFSGIVGYVLGQLSGRDRKGKAAKPS